MELVAIMGELLEGWKLLRAEDGLVANLVLTRSGYVYFKNRKRICQIMQKNVAVGGAIYIYISSNY